MPDDSKSTEAEWRDVLLHGDPVGRRLRPVLSRLPSSPRCKLCHAPFRGWGSYVMRVMGRPQSKKNPRYCEPCEMTQPGGAEVEISMLFADVRGSTGLAEKMRASEFGHLIGHFYEIATRVLVEGDALIDRLVGDEVIGLFIPGMAGPEHPRRAIEAAQKLTRRLAAAGEAGLPVGIGVHTGVAFVGVVKGGKDGVGDFTALGDNVNVTARLASQAAVGEILVSDAAFTRAGVRAQGLEQRTLRLKGKAEAVTVHVLRADSSIQ